MHAIESTIVNVTFGSEVCISVFFDGRLEKAR